MSSSRSRLMLGILASGVIALAFGCSKSSTTEASSDSSSSSSTSSSGDDDDEETSYQRDVREYTAVYASGTGDVPGLQRDLAAIAEEYGVTDWERQRYFEQI